MKSKLNGNAKWVIVALAILTVAFNSGVLYSNVAHLTKEVYLIRMDLKELYNIMLVGGIPQEAEYAKEEPTKFCSIQPTAVCNHALECCAGRGKKLFCKPEAGS